MVDVDELVALVLRLEQAHPERAAEVVDALRELVAAEERVLHIREHGSLLQRLVVIPTRPA